MRKKKIKHFENISEEKQEGEEEIEKKVKLLEFHREYELYLTSQQ